MYFRWKDRRLVVEMAAWGAEEGVAPQVLHTLADATKGMIEQGDAEGPEDPEPAVGIPRNAEPVRVDEDDRRMTLYFWHPEGEAGYFDGIPIDYKLTAPEAPFEGNRAFRGAVQGASGILLFGSDDSGRDRRAFEGLARAVEGLEGSRDEAPSLTLHYVVPPESPRAETSNRRVDVPDLLPEPTVDVARPWDADDVWEAWYALAVELRPQLERAREAGRIPTD